MTSLYFKTFEFLICSVGAWIVFTMAFDYAVYLFCIQLHVTQGQKPVMMHTDDFLNYLCLVCFSLSCCINSFQFL